ncbi:MAG TPA: hypothetical protein VLT45_03770 [Kofleriaceae bacterium]|nr:hypothetical protein [Kofleriaceae bacterium]
MRLALSVLVFLASACVSSSETEEFCDRAQTCNLLKGSVQECVNDLSSQLDQLPPSQRDELLYSVKQCLDRPSCSGFSSCINDLSTSRVASPELTSSLE